MHLHRIKKYFRESSAEAGSALILVLLVIVLLSTIAVSFLSTSRTEQTATRNYTTQTQAEQFATKATQLAMAKIQQGFNTTNATSGSSTGNNTQIVTTQPGRITKYFFLNGNCTGNATTALYTENGTALADLNNLQNPGNTTQVRGNNSDNQTFTITGNASNRLIVNMEDITSNGTLVGRVAYYTDDELTKININGATDNRTTLNVSTPRSMSLSAFTTANLTTFRNIIDGISTPGTSDMTNWGYFFRKEQAEKVTGFNGNQMSSISTAPLSDFHLKFTPWGARRLHINDEPLNSTGIDNVYNALNSEFLRNIYGQTFNDKYGQPWSWYGSNTSATSNLTTTDLPVNGLRQTAANLLQMRAAGTANVTTGGYFFTGNLVGNQTAFPPSQELGHTPYAVINEFGINVVYRDFLSSSNGGIRVYIRPVVEFYAPYVHMPGTQTLTLEVTVNRVSFMVQDASGRTGNWDLGPYTLTKNFSLSGVGKVVTNGIVGDPSLLTVNGTGNSTGNTTVELDFATLQLQGDPAWRNVMLSQQVDCLNTNPAWNGTIDFPWRIVGNVTVSMGDVKIYAGTTKNASALRDWVPGSVINAILGGGVTQNDVSGANNDDNDAKIQVPSSSPPSSFQVREPICSTTFYEKRMQSGNFLGGSVTRFSRNTRWPVSTNATLTRNVTTYGNASEAGYNTAFLSRKDDYSLPCTVSSNVTNLRVRFIEDLYGPFTYTSGNVTKTCAVTWTNNPAVPDRSNWFAEADSITAALEATANYGDAYGFENVTLQRIDPRIRGYGNSTVGYSHFVAAPYTFTRNINYPALLYMGGGNNDSNNPSLGCNTYYASSNYNDDKYGIQGIRIAELKNRDIPPDPSPLGGNEPEYFTASQVNWIYFSPKLHAFDYNGNAVFTSPTDLGKVITNLNWRTLRFMPRHQREAAKNLIPDWAMLDLISFSSYNSTLSPLKISPINPNGTFACNATLNNATISARINLEALLKPLELAGNMTGVALAANRVADPYFSLGSSIIGNLTTKTFPKVDLVKDENVTISRDGINSLNPYTYFRGTTPFAASISSNITSNSTTKWSTTNSTWSAWRTGRGWPSTSLVLPGEVTEVRSVADYSANNQYNYNINAQSFKINENRLSALFPGLTLQSNFFTIYAYAQAGQLQNKNQPESASNPFVVDSEALTKTLVEVEITTPATSNGTATTPAQYKVKKLYTQQIPLGQ